MTPDRRRITRWDIKQPTRIKLEGAEAYSHCTLVDINLKGVQLALTMKLPLDNFIRFSLFLADDFILNVEVWVAWQKIIDGHYLYGLYFSKIQDSDKEKIYRFLRRDFGHHLDKKFRQGTEEIEEKGGETMLTANFQDRRVFERFAATLPVRFLDTNTNQEGRGHTRDISAKGIGLVANQELPLHSNVELWLEVPDKGDPLYLRGEVAWSKVEAFNEYRAGINLEKADFMGLSRVLRMA